MHRRNFSSQYWYIPRYLSGVACSLPFRSNNWQCPLVLPTGWTEIRNLMSTLLILEHHCWRSRIQSLLRLLEGLLCYYKTGGCGSSRLLLLLFWPLLPLSSSSYSMTAPLSRIGPQSSRCELPLFLMLCLALSIYLAKFYHLILCRHC